MAARASERKWELRRGTRNAALKWAATGVLAGALAACSSGPPPLPDTSAAAVLRPSTELIGAQMPSLTGLEPRPGDRVPAYAGRVTIVEFGATNCVGCVEMAPRIERLVKTYPGGTVQLVHVMDGRQDTKQRTLEFESFQPVLYDAAGDLFDRMGVVSYPTFAVVDAHGRITWLQPTMRIELIEGWVTDAVAQTVSAP